MIKTDPSMSIPIMSPSAAVGLKPGALSRKRVESIDLLRGVVMIIMALDHVRDFFHNDAFLYSPTDLTQTSVPLFFTRWITHYCAPIFVFLAGISAWLYGRRKTKKELSFFLLTRGLWLVFMEIVVLSLIRTFNPTYAFLNLQVIWAIGISMIVMAGLIYLNRRVILAIGLLLVVGHNLLDNIHATGNDASSFFWSFLHEKKLFHFGHFTILLHYPILPWIGIMAVGYCFGHFYSAGFDAEKRKNAFFFIGTSAIGLFFILRSGNWYGDPALWSTQDNAIYSGLSFLNVTKYPPSLLYTLITIGPALIFLSLTEGVSNKWTDKIKIFGRVAMFYYLAHILLIHILALIAAPLCGYSVGVMILSTSVNSDPALVGYGFNLWIVYLVWIALILILYPFCKWFDQYKRAHLPTQPWLSYM